ncbi:type II toxin-antitoxin system SpoIISA family toxin, partial [Bacillus subtilis]|uniref:type II toxin-antitoxin system SpoIISA family toxin n=1 Tax=Bacillus subtilis TaxID=1423 RepID=UPI0020786AF6
NMVLLFEMMLWWIAGGVGLYVYVRWGLEGKVKEKMWGMGKSWYLVFVVGGMVYWRYEGSWVFREWEGYVIVGVSFGLIDGFMLLSG